MNNFEENIQAVEGAIDGLYGKEVHGWFFDKNEPTKKLSVKIIKKGNLLAEGACVFDRDDVKKIHGVSKCGFKIKVLGLENLSDLEFKVTDDKGMNLDVTNYLKKESLNINNLFSADKTTRESVLIKEVIALKQQYNRLSNEIKTFGLNQMVLPQEKGSVKDKLFVVDLSELKGLDVFEKFLKSHNKYILNFGIIPWNFRVQRPQHFADNISKLADAGVIYFNPSFNRTGIPSVEFSQITKSIIEITIDISILDYEFYSQAGSDGIAISLIINTKILKKIDKEKIFFAKIDHPSWWKLIAISEFDLIVYDKMDEFTEFSNSTELVKIADQSIQEKCDIAVFSAMSLAKNKKLKNIIIKNGCQIDHFEKIANDRIDSKYADQTIIGYLGAVSEWFDFELINHVSKVYPKAIIKIIGNVDTEIPEYITSNKNIIFKGEVPYQEIPNFLSEFDVGLIPFKITELIKHVDPVKLYEYAACGIPTVATNMPALNSIEGIVYRSLDSEEFVKNIDLALSIGREKKFILKRVDFAKENTWKERSNSLLKAINLRQNKLTISIVLLHYGRIELTEGAIFSILKNSKRNNELIVVDNSPGDLSKSKYLSDLNHENKIKIVTPEKNLGFAGGMNFGSKFASGDMLVLANNDIYVSENWDNLMLRHFSCNEDLALLGTVTNMAGNEQKMNLEYKNLQEMERMSKTLASIKPRKTFFTNNVAFIFVMIPKNIFASLDGLDEDYIYGYFEDDDFCKKVLKAGKLIGIADDVFVHHEHGASFNLFDDEKKNSIFQKNKSIFEKKWGKWIPHKYRDSPNFG